MFSAAPARPAVLEVGGGGERTSDPAVWLGAHLFFPEAELYGDDLDTLALRVLPLIVEAAREAAPLLGWFFIRYGEGGPHLRVRVCVPTPHAHTVKLSIRARLHECMPELHVDGWAGVIARVQGGTASDDGATSNLDDPDPRRRPTLRWVAYEPEVERYGGSGAVRVAERVFEASSNLAIALLAHGSAAPRQVRLGRALLALLATLHVYCGGRRELATPLALRYGGGCCSRTGLSGDAGDTWRRVFERGFSRQSQALSARVQEAWECLSSEATPPAVNAFHHALRRECDALVALCRCGAVSVHGVPVTDWHECVDRIVPSYLHMTSNRLGLLGTEEAYLGHLIAWTLGVGGLAEHG